MVLKASGAEPALRFGENTTSRSAPKFLRKVIATLALSRTSLRLDASCAWPLNEIVTTCSPRLDTSASICAVVIL
jgi:hypothetical protein